MAGAWTVSQAVTTVLGLLAVVIAIMALFIERVRSIRNRDGLL